jgi:hypothetical protein
MKTAEIIKTTYYKQVLKLIKDVLPVIIYPNEPESLAVKICKVKYASQSSPAITKEIPSEEISIYFSNHSNCFAKNPIKMPAMTRNMVIETVKHFISYSSKNNNQEKETSVNHTEEIESAEDMLEDGINDGRYADITDQINVDTQTYFFKAVVQFAKDYADQFKNE